MAELTLEKKGEELERKEEELATAVLPFTMNG